MKVPLSKKAIDMLDYNGYTIKQIEQKTIIQKSRSDSGCLIGFIFIVVFILIPTFIVNLLYGFLGLIVGTIIYYFLHRGLSKKSSSQIDQSRFKVDNGELFLNWRPKEFIEGVYTHSKFVEEYTSAFKSTSKEHQVTIGFRLMNHQLVPLLRLISDHEEPSKEMKEVAKFLESTINSVPTKENRPTH